MRKRCHIEKAIDGAAVVVSLCCSPTLAQFGLALIFAIMLYQMGEAEDKQ